MKHSTKLSYNDGGAAVEITIKVTDTGELMKDEVASLLDDLSDATMRAMNNARYLNAPLSKIKAR